jgi:hypothetical protein
MFIFCLFGIYLSTFIPIFSSFTLTIFHICFPTVLSFSVPPAAIRCLYPPLSHPIGCHHITRFATPPYLPESVIGFLSHLDSWPVRMGPIRCPETSVNNYHTMPRNTPEDRRFQSQWLFLLPRRSIFSCGATAQPGLGRLIVEVSISHTNTHTAGRTPLEKWSAHRRGRYLHKKHKRWTSMHSAGYEAAIPAIKRPQAYALDRTATGIDPAEAYWFRNLCVLKKHTNF